MACGKVAASRFCMKWKKTDDHIRKSKNFGQNPHLYYHDSNIMPNA